MRRLALTAVLSVLMVSGLLPGAAQAQQNDGSGVEKLWQRYPLEEGGKAVTPTAPTKTAAPAETSAPADDTAAPVDTRPGLPPAAPEPDSTSDSKPGWLTLSLLAPLVVVLVALLIEGLSRRRLRRPRRRRGASRASARNVTLFRGGAGRDAGPVRDPRAAQPMRSERSRTPAVRADSDD